MTCATNGIGTLAPSRDDGPTPDPRLALTLSGPADRCGTTAQVTVSAAAAEMNVKAGQPSSFQSRQVRNQPVAGGTRLDPHS